MRSWRRIEGGVEKIHSWGVSRVYGSFEKCFDNDELIKVKCDLEAAGGFSGDLVKIKAELKKRFSEVSKRETRRHG